MLLAHGDSEGYQETSDKVMEPNTQTWYLVPDPKQCWCKLARNFIGDSVRLQKKQSNVAYMYRCLMCPLCQEQAASLSLCSTPNP